MAKGVVDSNMVGEHDSRRMPFGLRDAAEIHPAIPADEFVGDLAQPGES